MNDTVIDFQIDWLQLNIEAATGQEHRIHPITTRSIAFVADHLHSLWADWPQEPGVTEMAELRVPLVSVDLDRMSDEQAADAIARALLEALALKLRV